MKLFKYKKAVQALNYFASLNGGEINKMQALKLIWISDRDHLRRYGRPIIEDNYVAMKFGPVASLTKDFVEENIFLPQEQLEYKRNYLNSIDRYTYLSVGNKDYSVFSQTDRDVMEKAFNQFGDKDQYKLAEFTHLYPEWKKHEKNIKAYSTSFQMDYIDFFKNPTKIDNDYFELSSEHLQLSKEMFLEESSINTVLYAD